MRLGSRRKILLVSLMAFMGWLGVCAWLLKDAGSHVADGRSALDEARNGATPASLLEDDTDAALASAHDNFVKARSRLRNPLLAPLRLVPVVGRHVRSADHIVASADGATQVATEGVADLRELVELRLDSGGDRIAVLRDLADLLARTHRSIAELDPGSSDGLITPMYEAVVDLTAERDETRSSLQAAELASRALADVLEGPMPYLLLGANNGEMRVGSGMFLSAATVRFDQGAIDLGDVRPTQELVLPSRSVPVGDDMAKNWPWLDPGRDFRNLALSADFPQSAEVATRMWPLVPGGETVGGVIAVDVDALRGLLRVVGPIDVGGVVYTADTVRGELLRDQYGRFVDDRDARRDRLGDVSREVFARIESGEWELEQMATALVEAVQGRHLMIWSADEASRKAWEGVGADGHLTDRSISMGLANRGANKLDSYVSTSLAVTTSRRADDATELTLTYVVTNEAPESGPVYVVGPNIDGMAAGEYRAIVVANLPLGVTDVTLDGARQTLAGQDGPTIVVGGELSVARGASATVTVTAVVPAAIDSVTLEASARIPRTRVSIGSHQPSVDRRRSIELKGDLGADVGEEDTDAGDSDGDVVGGG